MKLAKLTLLCAIALSTLTTSTAEAKPAKLKYTTSSTPKQGCLLPAVDATTVGKRVVDMFAKVQLGQTLQQVRSQVDLAPIQPKIYKSKYLPLTTLSYEIELPDDLVLSPNVSFNQHLKATVVTIGLYENYAEENQKSCYWEFVPASK